MPNRNDSSSPLSRLINDDNLTILENVIPYCNTNLGKLLALCLKFSEMQKIIEGFDDSERLNACGFENNSTDIESILRSVRSSVSEEKARQIDNILQILNFPDSTKNITRYFLNIPNSSVHLHQRLLKLKMLLKQIHFLIPHYFSLKFSYE